MAKSKTKEPGIDDPAPLTDAERLEQSLDESRDTRPPEEKPPETTPIIKPMQTTQTPEQVFPGAETVTMIFPRSVMVQYKPGQKVRFRAGTQEVPVDIADHPYLAACGVERYGKK